MKTKGKNSINGLNASMEQLLSIKLANFRELTKHPGLKGGAVEEMLSKLLEDTLPPELGVGTGLIIDSLGQQSLQTDLVIYFKSQTPRLFLSGGVGIFPVECVFAVIEVKTKLDKSTFKQIEKNMDSAKRLERLAYNQGTSTPQYHFYDRPSPTWQTIYLAFSIEGPDPQTLVDMMDQHRLSNRPLSKQVDSIYVVESGACVNATLNSEDVELDLLPRRCNFPVATESEGLTTLLFCLSQYTEHADQSINFRMSDYLAPPKFFKWSSKGKYSLDIVQRRCEELGLQNSMNFGSATDIKRTDK